MKKVISAVLILILMLSFAGCGSKSSGSSASGPLDGSTYTYDALKEAIGMEMTLTFADGKVTKQQLSDGNVESEASGTYKVEDSTISITIDGGTETGTINDDQTEILINDGGEGTLYHK